jgi:hypothetical protein
VYPHSSNHQPILSNCSTKQVTSQNNSSSQTTYSQKNRLYFTKLARILLHNHFIRCNHGKHLHLRITKPRFFSKKPSTISTGQLQLLPAFHLPPIKLVVSQRSYSLKEMGYLVLRWASHLDAFSGYPVRRLLLGYAVGTTTDTQELRPSRSSRTRDSSSQIPNAHSG